MSKIFECVVVELLSIVRDKDPWDSKAANDTLQDEFSDISLRDNGQWFCLDPFGEVVDPYDKEFELPYRHREAFYYVQSLMGEWLGGAHWCEFL